MTPSDLIKGLLGMILLLAALALCFLFGVADWLAAQIRTSPEERPAPRQA